MVCVTPHTHTRCPPSPVWACCVWPRGAYWRVVFAQTRGPTRGPTRGRTALPPLPPGPLVFQVLTRLPSVKLHFIPQHLFVLYKKYVKHMFSLNAEKLRGWLVGSVSLLTLWSQEGRAESGEMLVPNSDRSLSLARGS